SPEWLTNYTEARKVGRKEDRPLAVFLGSGQAGYEKVSRTGSLSPRVRDLLAQKYVCVYLNVDDTAAQKLANALEITRGRGLVLSDRSGESQAFHHDGDLSEADLVRNLERFANPAFRARTTETNGSSRVSYYPPSDNGGPVYVPSFSGRSC